MIDIVEGGWDCSVGHAFKGGQRECIGGCGTRVESGFTYSLKFSHLPTSDRHQASARFHEILAELASLHDRKQADYGRGGDPFANVRASEEWGLSPWVGAMVRATDKVRRLQSLIQNGKLESESAEDSLRDLAVYAVIALVLFEEERDAAKGVS